MKVRLAIYTSKDLIGIRGLSLAKTDKTIYEGDAEEEEIMKVIKQLGMHKT